MLGGLSVPVLTVTAASSATALTATAASSGTALTASALSSMEVEALKAEAKTSAPANFALARHSFGSYDLDAARSYLTKARELIRKSKSEWPSLTDSIDAMSESITLADDMLSGRVEKLVILDEQNIPAAELSDEYPLSAPSGHFLSNPDLQQMGEKWAAFTPFGPAYESEDGSYRIVAVEVPDTDRTALYEGFALTTGGWSDPVRIFAEEVDAAYPFMLSDGTTLYFASRSEAGLGGYDIFRSNRDTETGEYMNPSNVGMPYNSPADDFLLAIDEYVGAGYWASSRGLEGGDTLQLFTYVPSQMRSNYDADTENLEWYATLAFPTGGEGQTPWAQTWPDGADYTELFEAIRAQEERQTPYADEFHFQGPDGKVYTSYKSVPAAARQQMKAYQRLSDQLSSAEASLASARTQYATAPSDTLANFLRAKEHDVANLRSQLRQSKSDLFKTLK